MQHSQFLLDKFLGIRFLGFVGPPFPTFPSTLERCWSSWMCMFLAQCSEAKGSPCGEVRFHHGAQAWRYNQPEKTSEIDSCFWIYISFLDLLTEFESQKIPENKKKSTKSINYPPRPQKLQKHHRAQLCLEASSSWPVLKRFWDTIITNHSSPMCIQWKPWITSINWYVLHTHLFLVQLGKKDTFSSYADVLELCFVRFRENFTTCFNSHTHLGSQVHQFLQHWDSPKSRRPPLQQPEG